MPVEIGRALREGIERTVSRNGLTFLAFAYVLAVMGWAVVGYVPGLSPIPGGGGGLTGPGTSGPAIDLSPALIVVVAAVLLLVAAAVVAAALRTFATGDDERIALGHFTRDYPRMVANLAAGWVAQTVLVGGFWLLIAGLVLLGILGSLSGDWWAIAGLVAVGLGLLLVVPALVVLEAVYFWYVFVVVEDRGFVDAFGRSWTVVEGNRSSLFVLGLLVWVVNTLVTTVTFVLAFLLPAPAGFLIGQAGSALATVFTLATTARTYVQLVEDEADAGGSRGRERGRSRTPAAEPELGTRTR